MKHEKGVASLVLQTSQLQTRTPTITLLLDPRCLEQVMHSCLECHMQGADCHNTASMITRDRQLACSTMPYGDQHTRNRAPMIWFNAIAPWFSHKGDNGSEAMAHGARLAPATSR